MIVIVLTNMYNKTVIWTLSHPLCKILGYGKMILNSADASSNIFFRTPNLHMDSTLSNNCLILYIFMKI